MSRLVVHGLGAVSPAGWGVPALRSALEQNIPLPITSLVRPGWDKLIYVRAVPPPATRPAFLAHPRLRRASPAAQHLVAAALEALGDDAARVQRGELRLGVIVCLMAGCVAYSRRFYEEVVKDPPTASPLIFPETVFNAPASHLAAYLGSTGHNYSLVGDDGTFVQGLALAAQWLTHGQADACVVVGTEELDWIVADAVRHFSRSCVHTAGAGALYLKCRAPNAECDSNCVAELAAVTDSFLFTNHQRRAEAARRMRAQLSPGNAGALFLGTQNIPRLDAAELAAWADWTGQRFTPKHVFGEAFNASAAWQCIAVCDAVQTGKFFAASASVVGANQQAIGVRFVAANQTINS